MLCYSMDKDSEKEICFRLMSMFNLYIENVMPVNIEYHYIMFDIVNVLCLLVAQMCHHKYNFWVLG